MEPQFQFSKDTLIPPKTCSIRNLFNNIENRINICVHDNYKTLNGLSYVTAHIGNYEFNKITPKLIGSKQFFETSYIVDKHFTSGLNCIDIDWDGLQLDGKTINYTTDLIDYIHDLKIENNQLKQKKAFVPNDKNERELNNFLSKFSPEFVVNNPNYYSNNNSFSDTLNLSNNNEITNNYSFRTAPIGKIFKSNFAKNLEFNN